MMVTNTLSYYSSKLITAVKSFIVQALGICNQGSLNEAEAQYN
jgi:hypothetical protein